MLTAIVFIITLGILIFVHELGHFVVARRNGIKAEEFGFGFPPRIFGIQFLKGKKKKRIREIESIKTERVDLKVGNEEIIREIIEEKIHNVSKTVPLRKWRIIWGKHDGDDENEKNDLEEAHEKKFRGGTIYSLNWIMLGGFVKIKGENGDEKNEKDSFAGKSAWVRIKVLAAGVIMNFVLAWLALSFAFMIGTPQSVESDKPVKNSSIQISQVLPESPAEKMGLKPADQIVKCEINSPVCKSNFKSVEQVQNIINENKGKEIIFQVKRGSNFVTLTGTPRIDYPSDQGPLGISLSQTAIVSYSWYQAFYEGLRITIQIMQLIIVTFYNIIRDLIFGNKVTVDVSGPIGIAYVAKQFTDLGFVYILQFVALLSINLGIINALPFPALDGGRILFILIEKIKGSPVSQKIEQMIHNFGFIFLILLMIFVTFRDVIKFGIIDKIKGIF